MICPQCGYDMGNKSRCLRCGYVSKNLTVYDDKSDDGKTNEDKTEEPQKEEEKPDVKVIDPCNVYLTHPYGYEDDSGSGFGFGGPFGSLFDDLFGDPIGDLLGGLFGFDTGFSRRGARGATREEPPKKRRKQGPIVEMSKNDFEIVDDNGNPVDEQKERRAAHEKTVHDSVKHKNPFKRKPRK